MTEAASDQAQTPGDPHPPAGDTRPGKARSRNPVVRFLVDKIVPIATVVLAVTAFRSTFADWNDVPTGSMKPSILEGDRIFVNKLAYGLKVPFTTFHLLRWDTPQRGDIVVFYSPRDGTRLVKRVVALPGETVELRDNRLYINGQQADYQPLDEAIVDWLPDGVVKDTSSFAREVFGQASHPVMQTRGVRAMRSFQPVVVPQGMYFMLGDNRDNSADSRYIGMVPLNEIVGRSSRVAFSLNYENSYLPRWDRFFQKLP